jgi:basic amino acid/polyamine antiporter, APA family
MGLVVTVSALLILGVKQSALTNNIVVLIKIMVIIVFVVAMAPKVDVSRLQPFIPPNEVRWPLQRCCQAAGWV